MKDKIKLFLSKIKTNKTAKVSTVVACCIVLMAVAVSIAVGASVKRAPATAAKSGSSGESAQLAEAIEQTFSTTSAQEEPSTTVPATNTSSQWTQAEVDALVSEIKAYAQSKGFAINPSKGKVGTTWPNPIHAGKDKSKTKADLKETVDFFCGLAIEELGSVTGSINVFAEKYTDSNGLPQWEVYVVR